MKRDCRTWTLMTVYFFFVKISFLVLPQYTIKSLLEFRILKSAQFENIIFKNAVNRFTVIVIWLLKS
jgi:hypothetical protein